MGKMADFALDEVMDVEDERIEFRTGHIPLNEAIEKVLWMSLALNAGLIMYHDV